MKFESGQSVRVPARIIKYTCEANKVLYLEITVDTPGGTETIAFNMWESRVEEEP